MDAKDKDLKDEDPRDNARDNGGNDAGKDGEHSKGRRKEPNMSRLTWAVISTVLALLVAAGGYLLYKRLTRGKRVAIKYCGDGMIPGEIEGQFWNRDSMGYP